MNRKSEDNCLYFTRMGGKGIIKCLECNFEQEIVSFLHGVNWDSTGYQCQKCGKFHEIECESKRWRRKRCECGGKLERDKPIFCPECKTSRVTYRLKKIT
jgi:hypothetical protein